MKGKLSLFLIGMASVWSSSALAYSDCWTSYFDPSQFPVVYDDSGVRYIGGLPPGTTCGCSVDTSTLWISGAKKGTTAATLAASIAGRQVRFLLHEENSDGYCRSSIVEVKPS